VTIVTGFLGAGKTTLVNYILNGEHGKTIAVIENEFGEVNIDEALVTENLQFKEDIISMDNGCVSAVPLACRRLVSDALLVSVVCAAPSGATSSRPSRRCPSATRSSTTCLSRPPAWQTPRLWLLCVSPGPTENVLPGAGHTAPRTRVPGPLSPTRTSARCTVTRAYRRDLSPDKQWALSLVSGTQTFFINQEIGDLYRIDSILCLVDAKHVREHLQEKKADDAVNEAVQQVAFAVRVCSVVGLWALCGRLLFLS
jgi:hypothetical protein